MGAKKSEKTTLMSQSGSGIFDHSSAEDKGKRQKIRKVEEKKEDDLSFDLDNDSEPWF